MAKDLVLAIDQGTTGTTALLVDSSIRVIASHNVEFPNHYPQPGHVEHDVAEIWTSIAQAVSGALAKADVSATRIAAIGVTNQRETSLFWDRKTGQPIHRALVWQDRRTADACEALKQSGHEALGTSRIPQSSSSQSMSCRLNSRVREALEGSVTCAPHRRHVTQVSIVPNISSPAAARVRAPSTWSSSQAALVPEK